MMRSGIFLAAHYIDQSHSRHITLEYPWLLAFPLQLVVQQGPLYSLLYRNTTQRRQGTKFL